MKMIEIDIENIGGLRGKHQFKFRKGLNILEAPNATGKTSIINGIRSLILPSEELKKRRNFLNLMVRDGSVKFKDENSIYEREIHEAGDALFVTGDELYGAGLKADILSVAYRDNDLLNLVSTGKSIKPILDEFSDAKYYEFASEILKYKQRGTTTELNRYRDELRKLEEHRNQLSELREKKEKLLKEQEALEEIPLASAEDILKKQEKLKELAQRQTEMRIEIEKSKIRLEEIKEDIDENRRLEEYYNKQIEEFTEKHPDIDGDIEEIDNKIAELMKQKSSIQVEQKMTRIMVDETGKALTGANRLGIDECLACGNKKTSRADLEIRKRNLEKKNSNLSKIMGQINIEIEQNKLTMGSLQEERQRIKTDYYDNLNNIRQNLKFRENERKKIIDSISNSENELEELERQIKEIEEGFDENIIELMHAHEDLRYKLGVTDGEIEHTERAIKERADITGQVQFLDNKNKFLGQMITYMQNKAKSILDELINMFNERIREVYNVLEFKDFERIYIDPNTFEVNIIRKREGKPIRQPITSLSDSERSTVGIILMLAGKEQFLPEFPLFILDAVTTDYDETRFNRIVEYLGNKVPYVLVTKLSPYEEGEKLVIKHTV